MKDKKLLITGGTGSFGNAVLDLFLPTDIGEIRIFSRDEKKQHDLRMKHQNDKIKYVIGDVRDYQSVNAAMVGVDYVFSAAALKQVPSCEFHPIEAVKTNILGTENVLNAAVHNGVKKVVCLSTDKACLDFHSPIELDDGTTVKISDIVRDKKCVSVKTFDEDSKKFKISETVGWYKTKLNGRKMISISYENGLVHGRYHQRVLATEDHDILTSKGWKSAGTLSNKDMIVTNEYKPNDKQKCVLLGTILGDSSLVKSNSNRAYLKMGHAKDQLQWLRLKADALDMNYRKDTVNINKDNRQDFYNVYSKSSAYLTDIYDDIYINKVKIIPRKMFAECFNIDSKLLLSTLLQDDGCITRDNLIRLATHSFTKDDVEWLTKYLTKNGYECSPYKCVVNNEKYNTVYYETRFTRRGSNKLIKDLRGYFILDYKINCVDSFDKTIWNINNVKEIYYGKAIVNNHKYISKDVYCLDIKDTHNFIVNNVVVHNCYPINAMGMSKALMEKVSIAKARTNIDTIICNTRYGNVMGTRGSVLPVFIEQIKSGKPITITDPLMTRFMMSLQEAVELVLYAFNHGLQGDTFVQKSPAATIADITVAMAEIFNVNPMYKVIGTRHGEKKHEVLIGKEEILVASDRGAYYSVPMNNKSINYHNYCAGDDRLTQNEYYGSDNTNRLSVKELVELLSKQDFVKEALSA